MTSVFFPLRVFCRPDERSNGISSVDSNEWWLTGFLQFLFSIQMILTNFIDTFDHLTHHELFVFSFPLQNNLNKEKVTRNLSALERRKSLKRSNMVDTQHFCLRWNNYQSSITSAFENLRDDEDFVDVTLACDGRSLKAHRVVLSACSPYFRELLKVSGAFFYFVNFLIRLLLFLLFGDETRTKKKIHR